MDHQSRIKRSERLTSGPVSTHSKSKTNKQRSLQNQLYVPSLNEMSKQHLREQTINQHTKPRDRPQAGIVVSLEKQSRDNVKVKQKLQNLKFFRETSKLIREYNKSVTASHDQSRMSFNQSPGGGIKDSRTFLTQNQFFQVSQYNQTSTNATHVAPSRPLQNKSQLNFYKDSLDMRSVQSQLRQSVEPPGRVDTHSLQLEPKITNDFDYTNARGKSREDPMAKSQSRSPSRPRVAVENLEYGNYSVQ